MQRELKFRVWNGLEMVYDVTVGKFGVFYVNPSNNGLDENDSASLTPFTTKYSDTTPVMQFTGLKDKNGKEIWEGDVVKYGKPYHGKINTVCVGKIVYNEYCGAFQIAYPNYENQFVTDFCYLYTIIEVIGDIYSSPDLLK